MNIGIVFRAYDIGFRYCFKPHRLPDTGGTGVVAAGGIKTNGLFAARLLARTDIILGIDKERVFADLGIFGNIHFERGIAALMRADLFAVYKYSRLVIDRTKMQEQHARKVAFGKRELAAIADSRNKIGMGKAGELAFRAERNVDLKRKLLVVARYVLQTAFKSALTEIEVELPLAV